MSHLSNTYETEGLLPEEQQCGLRHARSTIDVLFVVRQSQELGRQRKTPLYLLKAYDSVDRDLLCGVLTRSGVPTKMLTTVRNFQEGMRVLRVRTDDNEHSGWFDVTQGLRQGCVLSPLLFNVFFAAALHVVLIVVRLSKDGANVPKGFVSTR